MNPQDFYFPKAKKRFVNRFCKILSLASYIPDHTIANEEIMSAYGLPLKNKIILKTIGVENRHIAKEDQADSDLLLIAARKCLENYHLKPEDLTRIIVNKYIGDNILPMTASRLQGKLGSSVANHAFDIDGGVSSFLFAVDAASRFVGTGDHYVLIASGGICNRFVTKNDPRVAFLFGDASAAVLFGEADEPHILADYFYSNHQFYQLAVSKGAQFLAEASREEVAASSFDMYQMDNWKTAEDFYKIASREIYRNLQEESGLGIEEIDLVLVTENNARIREITLEALGMNEDKSITLLKEYGNTMSAMLPLLLDEGFRNGRIQKGMNILLLSHGEGMSGGGMIYKV